MKEMVFEILNDMAETLTVAQLKKPQERDIPVVSKKCVRSCPTTG